jgi:hypothetical protein
MRTHHKFLKLIVGLARRLIVLWSCSTMLFKYFLPHLDGRVPLGIECFKLVPLWTAVTVSESSSKALISPMKQTGVRTANVRCHFTVTTCV